MVYPIFSNTFSIPPYLRSTYLSCKIHNFFVTQNTHVEPPGDLVGPGVGAHVALEVDVVALLDVGAVQAAPQAQDRLRGVCVKKRYICV